MILVEPGARRDEAGQRLGQFCDQRLPRRRRQILAHQHGFADRGEMAVARDDAIERERNDLGAVVLDQHQAGFGGADLGDRGRDRARQVGAARDRGLRLRPAHGDRIDQVGVHQERRMLEHPARNLRLIGGEPENHRRRRLVAECQRPRQRLAHQRRRIVEQHDERAFGRGAIIGRQIGIEIGARHGAGCLGTLGGTRGTEPLQELTNDHVSTGATRSAARTARDGCHRKGAMFNKAFTINLWNG